MRTNCAKEAEPVPEVGGTPATMTRLVGDESGVGIAGHVADCVGGCDAEAVMTPEVLKTGFMPPEPGITVVTTGDVVGGDDVRTAAGRDMAPGPTTCVVGTLPKTFCTDAAVLGSTADVTTGDIVREVLLGSTGWLLAPGG